MNNDHTWRTSARYDPGSDALRVLIGRQSGEYVEYVRSLGGPGGYEVTSHALHEAPPLGDAEIRLPEDMAKALLEALAEHFGGTGDTRQLRRDYEAERARVDKLLAVMCRPPFVVNGQVEPPIINLGGRT